MLTRPYFYGCMLIIAMLFQSCQKDDDDYVPIISPVVFDLDQVPYANLSEYNFFEGNMSDLDPVYGVLEYELVSPLFTDYANKKRFVWMPSGVKASYVSNSETLDFPVGSVLIKNFYYDSSHGLSSRKMIETRIMIMKSEGWVFANYKWLDDMSDAILDPTGSFVEMNITVNAENYNFNYKIPSEPECLTCHKSIEDKPAVIGVKPQNLNKMFSYQSSGTKNQLQEWIDMGYLENNIPSNLSTVVDWTDNSKSLDERVRSYLDINCAHCHSEFGHCSYRPMRFDYKDTTDPANLGICVEAHEDVEDLMYIIKPGDAENSILPYRLKTSDQSVKMPLLGVRLKHNEAIELIEQWINSLDPLCQ
ncbi:hypothetical protein [Aegicerativicinus sediminis]